MEEQNYKTEIGLLRRKENRNTIIPLSAFG